ncbi:MAG: hypothetical protein AB1713_02795 [Pseudomonadota bacterium]
MIASPKSLKSFIVAAAAAVSIAGFAGTYLILSSVYECSVRQDAPRPPRSLPSSASSCFSH